MTTIALGANARTSAQPAPLAPYNPAALFRAAILMLGAAAIHFAVAPDHLDE